MCSDRWPTKMEHWQKVFPNVTGRLGLFHYLQRMTKTMRKRHIDCFSAINQLLNAVYFYNQDDHEALLIALKEGTLTGKKHSDDDIADLKSTKYFRQRNSKCLRKEIRHPNVICDNLDQWFIRFKCTASEGSSPAQGRLDPVTGDSLFTSETKAAVTNCKEKAMHLQDPMPLEQMYDVMLPNPNSEHGLKEYLSRRGESNLESFHLMLAHFGNCGMRETLADNLNLTGTARFNVQIRHKLRLSKLTDENTRALTPSGWETVPDYFNHSELDYVNKLARSAGIQSDQEPFKFVEPLPFDNGERFFSEHLAWLKDTKPKNDENDMCLCHRCCGTTTTQPSTPNQLQETVANDERQINNVAPEKVPETTTTATVTPPAAAINANGVQQSTN